jgi:putative membrane protein
MWLKGFHLFFMTAWFAGLFYLPRIFVNHAEITDEATSERFRMMERKLYRFITPWMILTIVFGLWMLHDYAWAVWGHMLWLHIKLALIAGLVGYHFWCGRIVKTFAEERNRRSHVWYRWFNEIPVLLLLAIVYLASIKPF